MWIHGVNFSEQVDFVDTVPSSDTSHILGEKFEEWIIVLSCFHILPKAWPVSASIRFWLRRTSHASEIKKLWEKIGENRKYETEEIH